MKKIDFHDISNALGSPRAFSIYAVIGVAATAVLSMIAEKKYLETEVPEDTPVKERLVTAAKIFAPPFVSACVTTFCISKSLELSATSFNQLALENDILHGRVKKYGEALGVAALAGRKKEPEIRFSPEDIPESEDEPIWFCDMETGTLFQSTKFDILTAIYKMNRNFQLRGSTCINEWCYFNGIDEVPDGDYRGWTSEYFWEAGLTPWIDFEFVRDKDDILRPSEPVYKIFFTWDPITAPFEEGELWWGVK